MPQKPETFGKTSTTQSPLREMLAVLCGGSKPSLAILPHGVFQTSELTERQNSDLQDFCIMHGQPSWNTGIGIMDAADAMVQEALNNGNIAKRAATGKQKEILMTIDNDEFLRLKTAVTIPATSEDMDGTLYALDVDRDLWCYVGPYGKEKTNNGWIREPSPNGEQIATMFEYNKQLAAITESGCMYVQRVDGTWEKHKGPYAPPFDR